MFSSIQVSMCCCIEDTSLIMFYLSPPNITLSDVLGDVQTLGESLATKRNAKLVSATERITDGILFYTFDFSIKDGTHQLLTLAVNKGRIWSLDLNTTEKRWSKRAEMYNNISGSFMPKLS